MSLPLPGSTAIPEETARLARTICPKGTLYMHIRDQLGIIYENESFASLFSTRGQPAEAPWRLALVCIFQFIEGLTDRQAAEAVQQRIDWKYALALELSDPGFDFSVLSRISRTPRCWWPGNAALRGDAGSSQKPGPAESTRPPTDGFDPCAGGREKLESTGTRRRNDAPCPQYPRTGGS